MAVTDEIPKSRITLTYRTTVHGEPEDVTLPFRLLLMGDFSSGSSKDRELDLDQRPIRNLDGKNLDQLMNDMNMSVHFNVPNKIDPDNAEEFKVDLPINSMKSFTPAEIAKHVPKIKALLILRKLLLEVQGNLDNRKEFRKLLRALAQNEGAVFAMMQQLKGFESFKVPTEKKTVAPPAGGTPPAGTPPAGAPPAGTPPAGTPPAGAPPT
jgi:type VI secretion system protein ImpB